MTQIPPLLNCVIDDIDVNDVTTVRVSGGLCCLYNLFWRWNMTLATSISDNDVNRSYLRLSSTCTNFPSHDIYVELADQILSGRQKDLVRVNF